MSINVPDRWWPYLDRRTFVALVSSSSSKAQFQEFSSTLSRSSFNPFLPYPDSPTTVQLFQHHAFNPTYPIDMPSSSHRGYKRRYPMYSNKNSRWNCNWTGLAVASDRSSLPPIIDWNQDDRQDDRTRRYGEEDRRGRTRNNCRLGGWQNNYLFISFLQRWNTLPTIYVWESIFARSFRQI